MSNKGYVSFKVLYLQVKVKMKVKVPRKKKEMARIDEIEEFLTVTMLKRLGN